MASSVTSSRSTGAFDSWGKRTQLRVEIKLKNEAQTGINSYTTLEPIQGEAIFTCDVDTRFDQISILFLGTSRCVIERPGVAGPTIGRTSAFHVFLKLTQPIDESEYPQPRILEAGRTYTFPFTFVIPDSLLPSSCSHARNHPQVQTAHTQLPPSFGDPMLAGNGATLLDDMAPQMTQIQYKIRARMLRINPQDGSMRTVLDEAKRVRIIPATEEAPPLDVADDSDEYCARKEKDVKKGALRGKIGRIVMTAAQPKAFRLPMPRCELDEESKERGAPSTMTTVHVRFDPANENQKPPRLGTLWTKLKVDTYFASEPWSDFPSRQSALAWTVNRGIYPETVCLACRCVQSVAWTKHSGDPSSQFPSPSSSTSNLTSRRGSMQSNLSMDTSHTGPTASYTGGTYYTCSLLVPINLPKSKAFVPTFHSCLISRVYSLDLSLSYHTPSASLTVPNFSLRLPVQITTYESLSQAIEARSFSEQTSADEFFTPRTIIPPQVEYTERANIYNDDDDSSNNSIDENRGEIAVRHRSDTLNSGVAIFNARQAPPEYAQVPFTRRLSNRTVVVGAAC